MVVSRGIERVCYPTAYNWHIVIEDFLNLSKSYKIKKKMLVKPRTFPHPVNYYYYYYYYYYTPLEFFTSALTDGFTLDFEWQQVSSSLQDSSQDAGRS